MIRLKTAALIAGVFLASVFSSPVWADAIVSIAPATSTVGVGGTVTLDVNIEGAVDLYAYQFDLSFDPTIVSAVSLTEGTFLTSGGGTTLFFAGPIDNVAGNILFNLDLLTGPISGVNGNGTLAILTLSGLTAGTSSIDIANAILLDSTFNQTNATLESGALTVNSTAVPEPSTALLLLAGVAATLLLAVKNYWD